MTDLSNMIRWNTNFVRGLAQSVLERAKTIRGTLAKPAATPVEGAAVVEAAPKKRKVTPKGVKSKAKAKKAKATAVKTARRPKKTNA